MTKSEKIAELFAALKAAVEDDGIGVIADLCDPDTEHHTVLVKGPTRHTFLVGRLLGKWVELAEANPDLTRAQGAREFVALAAQCVADHGVSTFAIFDDREGRHRVVEGRAVGALDEAAADLVRSLSQALDAWHRRTGGRVITHTAPPHGGGGPGGERVH